MGIAIHYTGKVANEDQLVHLLKSAVELGTKLGWRSVNFENPEAVLVRVFNEEEIDYCGPTKGVVFWPHEWCEPLTLEFDKDLIVQDFCKTQFAGLLVHQQVCQFLKSLKPLFLFLDVEDDSEYWDSENEEALNNHLNYVNELIAEIKKSNKQAEGPIKLEDGRIIDVYD